MSNITPYKYRLVKAYHYKLPVNLPTDIYPHPLILIEKDGWLTVQPGFLWDGCSPKWNFFDLFIIGTPDGIGWDGQSDPHTYHASMVHDILCRYKGTMGLCKKDRADIFFDLLGNFRSRYLYYWLVRLLGP